VALRLIPDDDPRLRRRIEPCRDPRELGDLAQEMAQHLEEFFAIGLSANQVGHSQRLFVMRSPEGLVWHCVNPEWQPLSDRPTMMQEGCVTWPGRCLWVPRYEEIAATWWDTLGHHHHQRLEGIHSQCFQHEWDHLEGVTMWDRAQLSRKDRRRLGLGDKH
jgi:peptide deformylase